MLSLEEAQPQGGRMPPPTLLGCSVIVHFSYVFFSLFFFFFLFLCNHNLPVQPKCSKECLPSGGRCHTTGWKLS